MEEEIYLWKSLNIVEYMNELDTTMGSTQQLEEGYFCCVKNEDNKSTYKRV